MILRTVCLFLFACSTLMLTSCQNMANPLGGVTRMIGAMGRSVGRLTSDATPSGPLRLETGEVQRAVEAEEQAETLPEIVPVQPTGNDVALAR
jgi:hypothetical protein